MIKIKTEDGISHNVESPEAIDLITSPNTRASIHSAYDRGDWEPYTPPEPEPELPAPNWDGFNAAIMVDPQLNALLGAVLTIAPAIALGLPSALAQVATQGPTVFSLTFNALCQLGGATAGDRDAWAALAEANNLPADFVAIVRGG